MGFNVFVPIKSNQVTIIATNINLLLLLNASNKFSLFLRCSLTQNSHSWRVVHFGLRDVHTECSIIQQRHTSIMKHQAYVGQAAVSDDCAAFLLLHITEGAKASSHPAVFYDLVICRQQLLSHLVFYLVEYWSIAFTSFVSELVVSWKQTVALLLWSATLLLPLSTWFFQK